MMENWYTEYEQRLRVNVDQSMFARVKYLVIKESTIVTLFCLGFRQEASDIMLQVSFLSSRFTRDPLEPKEPSSSFVVLTNHLVQYQSYSKITKIVSRK